MNIQLRSVLGTSSPGDITVGVQDKTHEYLKTTFMPEVKVSAYLEQDIGQVESTYAELFVEEGCSYRIMDMKPGSRTRKVELPGAMVNGEQLILRVKKL